MSDRRLFVALDFPSVFAASNMVANLGSAVEAYKIGTELMLSGGSTILIDHLKRLKKRIFLDLKLHDIATTVQRSVAAACDLGVEFLSLHVAHREMLEAAVHGRGAGNIKLLGVTCLSDSGSDESEVLRKTDLALTAGLQGVIAPATMVLAIRKRFGVHPVVMVPGIRDVGDHSNDHRNVATPAAAFAAGADCIVVGRPITRGPEHPRRAAQRYVEAMRRAGSGATDETSRIADGGERTESNHDREAITGPVDRAHQRAAWKAEESALGIVSASRQETEECNPNRSATDQPALP